MSKDIQNQIDAPEAQIYSKVDRALEMRVIDWLQWSQFPESLAKAPDDSDMAQLTLELIGKRKRAYSHAIEVLRNIAKTDYRGNRPQESVMAYNGLKRLGEWV